MYEIIQAAVQTHSFLEQKNLIAVAERQLVWTSKS